MAGYNSSFSKTDGQTIEAADFSTEYNAIEASHNNTTGHKHDGTAGEGPVVGLIGDAGEITPNNKVIIDTANNEVEFHVQVADTPVEQVVIKDGVIEPSVDNDVDLGSALKSFKSVYAENVVIGTSVDFPVDSIQANDIGAGILPTDVTLDAANITTGTLSDARLSTNVPRLSTANIFKGKISIDPITAVNSAIEIGYTGGGATSAHIDFHSGATNIDYDSRIVATGGTGIDGQGTLNLVGAVQINGNTAWHAGNDGPGSLLDADTVDGIQASDFVRLATTQTITGEKTFSAHSTYFTSPGGPPSGLFFDTGGIKRITWNDGGGNWCLRGGNHFDVSEKFLTTGDGAAEIEMNFEGQHGAIYLRAADIGTAGAGITWDQELKLDAGGFTFNGSRILTVADEGTGNGLDADTVDGIEGNQLVQLSGPQSITGLKTFNGRVDIASTAPELRLEETDAAPDNKKWRSVASLGSLYLQGMNDAVDTFTTWGRVDRTGTAIDTIDLVPEDPASSVKVKVAGQTVWTAGNDGVDSGLDADLLDGVQGSNYARLDTANLFTQGLNISNDFAFIDLQETNVLPDNGKWRQAANSEQLSFQLLNDAEVTSTNWCVVTRDGMDVDVINFPNGTVQAGGNALASLQSVQEFGAHGVWTKPAGLVRVKVTVVGGGGGGGGANSTNLPGAGGGAGGTGVATIEAALLGATETITIGLGGSGGSSAGGDGSVGGTTSFGTHLTGLGGEGGGGSTGAVGLGGLGGSYGGTASHFMSTNGGDGQTVGTELAGAGGSGGSGFLGGGGRGGRLSDGSISGVRGSGGGGGHGVLAAGGAGASGRVFIEEYF